MGHSLNVRLLALVAWVVSAAAAEAECPPPPETVLGRQARPDGTVELSDGRQIRLAGVELSDGGRAALPALVSGTSLTIRPVGKTDRWGRLPAHIDLVEEGLLAQGLGHAAREVPDACLAPLLAAEAKGRAARAGIWAGAGPALAATNGEALTARLGRHVIVEGRVVSARASKGRVYLNFARYWKSGLSLIIAEKDWPLFAGGATPESFAGKRLRVRGPVEWGIGPAIHAGADDRVEVVGP